MLRPHDHIYVVSILFLAVLGCFTTTAIVGSDGFEVLRDVLLALAGAVSGMAVASRRGDE